MLDGVIFRYTIGNAEEEGWTKPKQVPSDKVVANIEGCWMNKIKYRRKGEKVGSSLYHDPVSLLDRSVPAQPRSALSPRVSLPLNLLRSLVSRLPRRNGTSSLTSASSP